MSESYIIISKHKIILRECVLYNMLCVGLQEHNQYADILLIKDKIKVTGLI